MALLVVPMRCDGEIKKRLLHYNEASASSMVGHLRLLRDIGIITPYDFVMACLGIARNTLHISLMRRGG